MLGRGGWVRGLDQGERVEDGCREVDCRGLKISLKSNTTFLTLYIVREYQILYIENKLHTTKIIKINAEFRKKRSEFKSTLKL